MTSRANCPNTPTICSLLEETGDQFPEDFFKMKVLPELLKAVEYGGGRPSIFLALVTDY